MSDPRERFNALACLAQFRLGFLETIQLDKAIQEAAALYREYSRIRLAIVTSCTIDHLLPAIRVSGVRRGLFFEVYAGHYGQYRQELLDAASPLRAFDPDFVLLSLDCREAIASVPLGATMDEAHGGIFRSVAELRELWGSARDKFNATVIQQSFLDVSESLFGSYDRFVPGNPKQLVATLNNLVADAAAQNRVLLLDIAKASVRAGIDTWFDVGRWLQGRIEIAPQAAPIYGELLSRLIGAQRGQSKKCLVLDLDNTLWGGVIGDDGIEGIVLGEGSAQGEAHLALQRYAKALKERGIILAVCSKNDLATAEAPFQGHPEMVLGRSDIAAFVANWNDKAENLKAIAGQLNIGLDSLVFVDDNPAERARVRESLPMVAVPELPPDVSLYVRCIAEAGYFEAVSFTREDQDRAAQYTANTERETLREGSQSVEDFLRSLDMTISFGPIGDVDLVRATQLINKTNQFNTTTKRYSSEELSRFVRAPENVGLQFRLSDRFGDNGLVSVMLLRSACGESGILEIDTWVMSCRVFARQLEMEAMNIAVEAARSRGVHTLHASYIQTRKNGLINNLFEDLAFLRISEPAEGDGASRWSLDVGRYINRSTFIARRERA